MASTKHRFAEHKTIWGALLIFFALIALVTYVGIKNPTPPNSSKDILSDKSNEVKPFVSESEFRKYLQESEDTVVSTNFVGSVDRAFNEAQSLGAPMAADDNASLKTLPQRYSETNVQVLGIDEPDIVKTDGKSIFYSSNRFYEYLPLISRNEGVGGTNSVSVDSLPSSGSDDTTSSKLVAPEPAALVVDEGFPKPRQNPNNTKVINAFPPNDLEKVADIDMSGQLLLADKVLMVISNDTVNAYNVENPQSPLEAWKQELDARNSIVASRLLNGKLYIVSERYLNDSSPCPIPLSVNGNVTIACTSIYHPVRPIQTDVTFTISQINTTSGEIEETTTFVGSSGQSVVYVSPQSVYVAYEYSESQADLMFDFFLNTAADTVSEDVLNRINEISSYNLHESSKLQELSIALESYYNSLSADKRKILESDIQNRASEFGKRHLRDIVKTGLVKVNLSNFKIAATGSVPGRVLNQFSLDEYSGHLRLATTTDAIGFFSASLGSVNDIYVLDENLKQVGSILGLGLSERIYSARFVGDKGYLVTFKQIDPFYVLDLANPSDPKMAGELKIPGFSSYLHQLDSNLILGIGRDGGNVKASLFDVTDPNAPVEKSTYLLNESWSDIQNTHHAFLQDAKHGIFFVPGVDGGYVFGYKGSELELKTAVANIAAERALYIDNYLYVVGNDKIVVLDETTWQRVNELSLN